MRPLGDSPPLLSRNTGWRILRTIQIIDEGGLFMQGPLTWWHL
jgi:hypothetical protein